MPHDSTDPATVARAGSHASIAVTPEKRASPALHATHDKKFARSPSTAPHPRTDSTDDISAGTRISPLVPKETDPGATVTRSRPTPPSPARASHFVHKKKKYVRIYTSMHSGGVELTKLTYKYSGHEDNLPGHRGDEADYMLLMVSGFSTERGTYACQAIYCCRPL